MSPITFYTFHTSLKIMQNEIQFSNNFYLNLTIQKCKKKNYKQYTGIVITPTAILNFNECKFIRDDRLTTIS